MSKHMRTRAQKIWREENKTNFLILAISNGGGKQMSVLKKKNKTKQKTQKNPEPTLNVLPKELKKHKPNQGNRSLRNNLLCPHELHLSAAKESFIFSLIEANVREV